MYQKLIQIFPDRYKSQLQKAVLDSPHPEEIRFRVNQPVILLYSWGEQYIACTGEGVTKDVSNAVRVTAEEMEEMLSYISSYSLYAFEEEVKRGFLTLEGGHRIGLAGQVILEGGQVKNLAHITFLNIRIAGAGRPWERKIVSFLYRPDQGIYNTLLLSAPGIGKTTCLRQLIYELSEGDARHPGMKISVVDERSELAACCRGIPQNCLGSRTDVMDGCPKPQGMELMLRAMSPQILAVDELGTEADFLAARRAVYCGCYVLGTIHAGSLQELKEKPQLQQMLAQKLFSRFLLLQKDPGGERSYELYDEQLERVC